MPNSDLDALTKQIGSSASFQNALARMVDRGPLRGAVSRLVVALAHDVTVGNQPGFGSGQNDTFVNRDNVDATHPMNLSYLIPSNSQRVVSARLSWRLHAYRTYNSFSATVTGNASVNHTHAGPNHNHNHGHNMAIGSGGIGGTVNMVSPNGPLQLSSGGPLTDTTTINNDATNGGTGATGGQSVTHTHSLSLSGALGVTEGVTATGITIAFDGVDQTAKLGGPWSTDVVELNVTPFLTLKPVGAWHLITLSSTTLGQIESHLRIGFYANAGGVV